MNPFCTEIYERLDESTKRDMRELKWQLKYDNKLTESQLELILGVRKVKRK